LKMKWKSPVHTEKKCYVVLFSLFSLCNFLKK